MSTFIRITLVALSLFGAVSAASANPDPRLGARHYFEQQQHEGN